jgi:3-oxoacyl-[acyl-carrier protein] reductase
MILEGKTAVVTGGSRGIGRAICLKLAKMGAVVYINYVSRSEAAEETKKLIDDDGGKGAIIGFDIGDEKQVQDAFKNIKSKAGSVDILVNNAGITRDGLMAVMKTDDWDDVINTNLKGAFLCSKAASRIMMKKRWGRIINITSLIGFSGNSGQANYSAAKAGLVGLTKSMAREYASRNITVNGVAPGYIATEMTASLSNDLRDALMAQIPLGTLGTGEDVAGAVAYLAGEDSKYVTGQILHVNGGMYM